MPLILPPDAFDRWLRESTQDLLQPYPGTLELVPPPACTAGLTRGQRTGGSCHSVHPYSATGRSHAPAASATPLHRRSLHQQPLPLATLAPALRLPLFQSKIQAGFPSPASDYMEDGLDLNDYLVQHKAASFLFHVQGDSMRNAGIVNGDKVVVDRSLPPQHNRIVIAVVDGEYTIKRLFLKPGRIELRSENPAYPPIVIAGEVELEVWGVVVGVVRRYAD
jgi:DNA polymerase V